MITRRSFMTQAAALSAGLVLNHRLWAQLGTMRRPVTLTIYKTPTCGCCTKWVDYVKAAGFQTVVHDMSEVDEVKDNLGVPQALRSCHTTQVDRYVIEGHVPADDIRRLLDQKLKVAGLAAPGMPASSPGMAVPGAPHEPYEVLAFQLDGKTEVYARH
jgi:hypothetical protein